jgi:uncharacterized membrane protein
MMNGGYGNGLSSGGWLIMGVMLVVLVVVVVLILQRRGSGPK